MIQAQRQDKDNLIIHRRIRREVTQIQEDEDGISASTGGRIQIFQSPSDTFSFNAVMGGPINSPYGEGIFSVSIQIPADYPFRPPDITFATPIWHPNVNFETGRIFLDALSHNWNPVWTLQSILLVVFSLLQDPVMDQTPRFQANSEAADAYRDDRQQFEAMAAYWTDIHAGTRTRVSRLVRMGFDGVLAQAVLEQNGWDEDAAVTALLAIAEVDAVFDAANSELAAHYSDMNIHGSNSTAPGEHENRNDPEESDTASNGESNSSWSLVEDVGQLGPAERSEASGDWVNIV